MRTLVLALSVVAMPAYAAPAGGMAIDEGMGRRVQEVLRAHDAAVFACVAKQGRPVEGEALLRFFVGSGKPSKVDVLKVEPESPEVRATAECVAADARTWELGALAAEPGDQVVFPLQFHPEPSNKSAAVAARIEKVTLTRGGHEVGRIEHPVAVFVSRGSLEVRFGGDRKNAMTNEVIYFAGEGQMELSTVAGCELVRVETNTAPGPAALLSIRKPPTAIAIAGGNGRVQLYLDGTAAPVAVDKLCAKRGTDVPTHTHDSDELVYVLMGRTHTMLGSTSTEQRAGETVVIPRGTPHSLHVDQDLCGIQVYAPNGPEQRFKQPPKK